MVVDLPGIERVRALADRLRASLFALPAAAVVVAFVAARLIVGIDVGEWAGQSTVDNARAVLSTVAAATITFASVVFSVSLLVIQQGANQYSPRVLHGLVRDPFNRRVIAVVMATFTFCLVTLQQVRAPVGEDGEAVIPQLSVIVALVLGLIAVLSVVAVIHHTSRNIDPSVILDRIVAESQRVASDLPAHGLQPSAAEPREPPAGSLGVPFGRRGWVRSIDLGAIAAALAPGATARIETAPGRYAIEGMVIARVWPAPDGDTDDLAASIGDAIDCGATRTMRHDPGFAVRQLVDVALRALSPGINDPTTALDAMMHLGTVLFDRLTADLAPAVHLGDEGRRVELAHRIDDEEILAEAFDQLRAIAATDATVSIYLLDLMHTLSEAVVVAGRLGPVDLLAAHARRLRDSAEQRQPDPGELDRVLAAYERRFAPARR